MKTISSGGPDAPATYLNTNGQSDQYSRNTIEISLDIRGYVDIPARFVERCSEYFALVDYTGDSPALKGRSLVVDFAGPRTQGILCLIREQLGGLGVIDLDDLEPNSPIVGIIRDVLPLDISQAITYGALHDSEVIA